MGFLLYGLLCLPWQWSHPGWNNYNAADWNARHGLSDGCADSRLAALLQVRGQGLVPRLRYAPRQGPRREVFLLQGLQCLQWPGSHRGRPHHCVANLKTRILLTVLSVAEQDPSVVHTWSLPV